MWREWGFKVYGRWEIGFVLCCLFYCLTLWNFNGDLSQIWKSDLGVHKGKERVNLTWNFIFFWFQVCLRVFKRRNGMKMKDRKSYFPSLIDGYVFYHLQHSGTVSYQYFPLHSVETMLEFRNIDTVIFMAIQHTSR